MHEKTLLYGAIGATAIAATFGILHARSGGGAGAQLITHVSMIDSSGKLAGAASPIALTASDGSGLALVALTAKAVVQDPLALTELRLVFQNPESRIREGTFRITLPQGASLSRFAMKVNGAWQEGEVVEKQAARRAYEDFLHRKQDPALLEQGGGNEFTARVFPIPANGTKELIVTYAEVLGAHAPYALPLKGLPALGTLDIDVQASGDRVTSYGIHKQRFAPGEDFVIAARDLPRSPGLRSGELAIVRVVPFATSRPDPVASAVVLVDTSASRALGLEDQGKSLRLTLAKLGDVPVSVAAFDQEVTPLYQGSAAGFGDKELAALINRGALGGSNLERALDWANEEAKKTKAKRVILVTDGVATIGETDAQKLRAKVEPLRAAGVERIDAVAVGGIRDDGLLRTVVRGVLDKDGVVLDGTLAPATLARRLSEATSSGVPVKVAGSTWSWPSTLDGMQSGDEVTIFAKMESPTAPLKLTIGEQSFAPDARTIDRPLVERAVARAEIDSLVERPTKDPEATKRDIVALSTKHRVLSPHTALLVLETDSDYARFGIDRNAKIDILGVESGRVAVLQGDRGSPAPVATTMAEGNAAPPGAMPRRAAAAAPSPRPAGGGAAGAGAGAAATQEEMLDALRGGSAVAGALSQSDIPPVDLSGAANSNPGAGVATGNGDLRIGGGGAPIQGGARGGGLAGIGGGSGAGAGMDSQVRGPRADAQIGATTVTGGMIADVDRVIAGLRPRFRQCYQSGLNADPNMAGRLLVEGSVSPNGEVAAASPQTNTGLSPNVAACVASVIKRAQFSAPGGAGAKLRFTVTFLRQTDTADPPGRPSQPTPRAFETPPKPPEAKPYDGPFKGVMERLARGDKDAALSDAKEWQRKSSGDVMALVGLGEAYEAKGDTHAAARAYGSILELFASRADSRRFAGERLERMKDPFALELAADSYGKAVQQRPDHPASHRLYAFTLLKAGQHEKAFQAIVAGSKRTYPGGRFAGVDRILHEDVNLIAAAWIKAEPKRTEEIVRLRREASPRPSELKIAGVAPTPAIEDESTPSLRFVLVWETDANDVDFHIYDGKGGHAYYGDRQLPSGGELYADVTTGYGPECFTIRGPREARAYPYTLQAHYYSRGPMGYGMGKLQIIEHDGKGTLTFEERPFVVMVDRAFVDLGTVERPKK